MKHRFFYAILVLIIIPPLSWAGYIENHSYETLCAEMDNINVPITHSNVTHYRITATHPHYVPAPIFEWGEDFSHCVFTSEPYIWQIGYDNGSNNEFLNDFTFEDGDVYYPVDTPSAGNDENSEVFPQEINNDWMNDQYIRFTTDQDSDYNQEVHIGAVLIVDMSEVSGTLQIQALAQTTNDWLDLGYRTFTSSQAYQTWNIPDHTWIDGTDSNVIHLKVITNGTPGCATTSGAWAHYDFLKLHKRGESGEASVQLYAGSNTSVEAVTKDFWWLDPDFMTIQVLGGNTSVDAAYLRLKQRQSDGGWNENFVLYQDGNARIIPLSPPDKGSIPYGASIIIGPSTNSMRPFCVIDEIVVDPEDLSLELTYRDGHTAHVEIRSDHTATIVDVSGIDYSTNLPFARYRSMWVMDGKSDIDRVRYQDGHFPIMDNWESLNGLWWQFYRESPSYHNTYCPDFRVDILGGQQSFLTREAEDMDSGSQYSTNNRSNASSETSVLLGNTSASSLSYHFEVSNTMPTCSVLIHYSDPDGATGDYPGDTVSVIIDQKITNSQKTVCTGDWNDFESLPFFHIGTLEAGSHELTINCSPGTAGVEIDKWEILSQPSRTWPVTNLVTHQAESYTWVTNATSVERSNAMESHAIHLEHTGTTASCAGYSFSSEFSVSNVYLGLRYSDDVSPTRLLIYIDNELRCKTPTRGTGGWNNYTNTDQLFLGNLSAGPHELKIECDFTTDRTWGADLDEFMIYRLVDNQSPYLPPQTIPIFPVGMNTGFVLLVSDPDGQEIHIQNPQAPNGAVFTTNDFNWTAQPTSAGLSNAVTFVLNDMQGLPNSIVTNTIYVEVPFDYDGNGIGDDWEWTYFSQLGIETNADPDNDGINNLYESIAGTEPDNPNSFFTIHQIPASPQSNKISVQTQPRRLYTIYYTDCLSPANWTPFANSSLGTWYETNETASIHTFIDNEGPETSTTSPLQGTRYYRVTVQRPTDIP